MYETTSLKVVGVERGTDLSNPEEINRVYKNKSKRSCT